MKSKLISGIFWEKFPCWCWEIVAIVFLPSSPHLKFPKETSETPPPLPLGLFPKKYQLLVWMSSLIYPDFISGTFVQNICLKLFSALFCPGSFLMSYLSLVKGLYLVDEGSLVKITIKVQHLHTIFCYHRH